ncbi:MAG: site-specific integrase, partial [Acidobacteria bacterium]|nr:site-specific integrase [Acidobacteriota bacterium]
MNVQLKRRPGKRGTSLFLAWWAGGRWNYEFLKLRLTGDKQKDKETERLAERLRANREEELESMAWGTAPKHKRKMSFMDYFESLGKNNRNWQTLRHNLKQFPGAHVPIGSIGDSWVRKFRDYLLDHMTANSAYVIFSTLKSMLARAVREKLLTSNPAEGIEPIKRTEVEIAYLTAAEVQMMAATPCSDPELKRAFLFSCYTGMRFSDVARLKWENYQDGKLNYRQKKTKGFEYISIPRGGPAERLLTANKSFVPHVFNLGRASTLSKILKRWAAAAGIKKHIHYHVSRHTAATLMLENGVDLFTVSKILGHSSIAMTQRYAKVT